MTGQSGIRNRLGAYYHRPSATTCSALCSDKHLDSRDARHGAQELLPNLLRHNCLQTLPWNNPVPLSVYPGEVAEGRQPSTHGKQRRNGDGRREDDSRAEGGGSGMIMTLSDITLAHLV